MVTQKDWTCQVLKKEVQYIVQVEQPESLAGKPDQNGGTAMPQQHGTASSEVRTGLAEFLATGTKALYLVSSELTREQLDYWARRSEQLQRMLRPVLTSFATPTLVGENPLSEITWADVVRNFEVKVLTQVLKDAGGKMSRAAVTLRISEASLRLEIQKRNLGHIVDEVEKDIVSWALNMSAGNISEAAERLSIESSVMSDRIKKYGLGHLVVDGSEARKSTQKAPGNLPSPSLDDQLRQVEVNRVTWALANSQGNVQKAAELLNIKQAELRKRVVKLNLFHLVTSDEQ